MTVSEHWAGLPREAVVPHLEIFQTSANSVQSILIWKLTPL